MSRRFLGFLLSFLFLFGFVSCAPMEPPNTDTLDGSVESTDCGSDTLVFSEQHITEAATEENQSVEGELTEDCDAFNLEKYLLPYWEGKVIYNESVMPLENENGEMDPVSLLYDIEKIISVRSASLETLYEEGKDYVLEDGKLVLLPDGSIPLVEYSFLYPSAEDAATLGSNVFPDLTHGFMYFSEGAVFHNMQLAVTYIPKGEWEGPTPEGKSELLPKTMEKLKNGKDIKAVVYGDSISVGANSTKFLGAAPYCENYFEMVFEALEEQYGSKIPYTNPSLGGAASSWGAENVDNLVCREEPDLVIIAFGMNDGTGCVSEATYEANIRAIIDSVKAKNPDCEFILVAPMLQNEDWSKNPKQADYLPVLLSMEEKGCAVADITSLHEYLLTQKRYCDMTGNHVNHPNDFLVRLYAQVILQTFR